MSAGTELSWFKGTNPFLRKTLDPQLRLFTDGPPPAAYPVRKLGYMEVGLVTDTRTPEVRPGGLVSLAIGHTTSHVVDGLDDHFVPLPPDLDPLLGIYLAHMGPICANALLHAAAETVGGGVQHLGDGVRGRHVLITGAGVVGLLTGLFALHHGAAVVAVADRTPARLAAAAGLGMVALPEDEVDVARLVKQRWRHDTHDRGADLVFQCRGRAASLATALRSLRPQGTVIDLAFYQEGVDVVQLGEEFHHNGLTIRAAQIGRVPRGQAHLWDRHRLALETLALLRVAGDGIARHLVTDIVPFDDAPGLLTDLAARRRHVIQAVFEMPAARRAG